MRSETAIWDARFAERMPLEGVLGYKLIEYGVV